MFTGWVNHFHAAIRKYLHSPKEIIKVYNPVKATSSATVSAGKLRDEGVPSGMRGFPLV